MIFQQGFLYFSTTPHITMLQMFSHWVVTSAIFYAVVCWGSRVKAADANRLNKLIRKAGSVLGVELDSLVEVLERRMLSELLSIMDNASHPLHATMVSDQSTFSRRLRLPRCTTECHRRSVGMRGACGWWLAGLISLTWPY